MKTLENGVVVIQQEKLDLTLSNYELMKKCDDRDRSIGISQNFSHFRFMILILDLHFEQISFLNNRNIDLSRKCFSLVEDSKKLREIWSNWHIKIAKTELNFSTESEKLKAQLESLQKECDEISKKHE